MNGSDQFSYSPNKTNLQKRILSIHSSINVQDRKQKTPRGSKAPAQNLNLYESLKKARAINGG